MATTLYLRNIDSGWGTGRKLLSSTRGAASTTSVTNTVASGTSSVSDIAGGTFLAWWFRVGAPVTIASSITARIRGLESSLSANACFSVQLDWCTVAAVNGAMLAMTTVPAAATELTTADTAYNLAAVTPTSQTIPTGDFIRLTVRINPVGTMAAGFTATMSYDGPTSGAVGDTFITFTETIVAYGPEVLTAKLPGPPKTSLAATMVNPGVWAAPNLPLLTSQNSGTNNNLAAWAAKLPLLTGQTVDANVPAVLQSTVDDQGATSDVAQTATLGQLTQGSVIIAVATVSSSTLDPVITDDQNLAWSPIPTTVYTATMGKRINIYWAWNTSTAAALNVTATYSAAATSRTLSLTEVRGLDPNPNINPWDNFTGLTNSASTASLATAALRTWTPGEFIFAVAATTGTAQPTLTSGATPTQDTWAATSKILTEYRLVRGTADVTMAISQAPTGAASIIAVSFLPSGKHSPQVSGGTSWTSGSDGLTLPNPPARGSTYKLVVWVFVNWADATPHVVGDVTVTGYINAGFIYATDGVTGHALWVGWRDSVGGDAAGVVHATGAQAVAGTTQTVGYAVGAPRPSGMPWVAPGPQGATTFGAGGGPVSVPGPVPADQWGLNSAFINSLTAGPAVVGSPPLNWVQQGSNGSARYLFQAPLNSPSQETVTVTPQGGAAATVLSGLIDNGLPGQAAAIAARLPLATTALTGTMTDQGAWPAANLPVLTGQTVATQVNSGVLAAQVATSLSNQTTATQVNPGAVASKFSLLTCSLFSGNILGVTAANLPIVTALLTGTMTVPGVLAAKTPVLVTQLAPTQVVPGVTVAQVPLLTSQTANVVRWDADWSGQPSATVITFANSGGGMNSPFNSINFNPQFAVDNPFKGIQSARLPNPGSGIYSRLGYTYLGQPDPRSAVRFYFLLEAFTPPSVNQTFYLWTNTNTGYVGINTSGAFFLLVNNATVYTGVVPLTDTWYWMSTYVVAANPGTVAWELHLASDDSLVDSYKPAPLNAGAAYPAVEALFGKVSTTGAGFGVILIDHIEVRTGPQAQGLIGRFDYPLVTTGTVAGRLPLLTGSLNDVASVVIAARLPLLTGSLSGAMTLPGATQAPKLPVLTTALAPGMWNNGVWGGTLASALTNQTTATQVNPASAAPQFPLLTCSLFSGNLIGTFTASTPLLTGVLTGAMTVTGTTSAKLPVPTGQITGLATNSGVWGGQIASVLTSQTTLYQADPAVVAGQVASVLTATITGTVNIPGIVAGTLPLLTGQIDNTNRGFFAASLPLLTTQLTLTSANNDGVLVLELPLLMGTFWGGPFYPGDLVAEMPGPIVATLTGLSTDKAVLHAKLPRLRSIILATSVGVHVDISVTAGATRVYGIDAGTTRFRVFVTPGPTTYDAVKAGPTHTGLSAGYTRIQRGPR